MDRGGRGERQAGASCVWGFGHYSKLVVSHWRTLRERMPRFRLGLDAQAAGQRWFGAVKTEEGEQEGGWSLLSGDRVDAGLAQSGSCGDREGTDVCFAVETTDVCMDPEWNIRAGGGRSEEWGVSWVWDSVGLL